MNSQRLKLYADNFDISYYSRNISYDGMWNLTPLERDVIVDRLMHHLDKKQGKHSGEAPPTNNND